MAKEATGLLLQLAHLYGVQTAYYDVTRKRRQASPEVLMLVLKALGAGIEKPQDAPAALRQRQQETWQQTIEPVIVVWQGEDTTAELHLPADIEIAMECELRLEGGETRRWLYDPRNRPPIRAIEVDGRRYEARSLSLSGQLPAGYHQLSLQISDACHKSTVICAPAKAYALQQNGQGKAWGVFAPLYALHSKESLGAGNFSDLKKLMEWSARLGAGVVGTLPLLAAFLDEPFEPSPYLSASRLFWNEFYIDVTSAPEFERSREARAALTSKEAIEELRGFRSGRIVDYRRGMALRRRVLEEMARAFFREPLERESDFQQFLTIHPQVQDYAQFRAVGEAQRKPWPEWPSRLRDGLLENEGYSEDAKQYHLYVQWLADRQIKSLAETARKNGQSLYLDLPLGVHPYSYDVWRERGIFAHGTAAGAPPDSLFLQGQNWGFQPLNPESLRRQSYRYFIAALRHHLQYAGLLRIDHVMGLHRLFWIPDGFEAKDGVYVRYPAEELYAILCLESHRRRAAIVGEDLGTVPGYVPRALRRHNIQRLYVVQYEASATHPETLRSPPTNSLASLNTHDMPTFSSFYKGLDIEALREFGFFNEEQAEANHQQRQALKEALVTFLRRKELLQGEMSNEHDVYEAVTLFIGASPAALVLVSLEDLWQEQEPQNIPGTRDEHPNWRRKMAYAFEELSRLTEVLSALRSLDRARATAK